MTSQTDFSLSHDGLNIFIGYRFSEYYGYITLLLDINAMLWLNWIWSALAQPHFGLAVTRLSKSFRGFCSKKRFRFSCYLPYTLYDRL